jgi:hypothetical protein
MLKIISCSILLASLFSCAAVNTIALRTTADVIQAGSDEALTEGNYEHFKAATPANLKLLEGLWFSDQKNKTLLGLLVKGYSAFAFAVAETEALEDILLEKAKSQKIDQVLMLYEKAIYYGEKYLQESGISKKELWNKEFPSKLKNRFNEQLDKEDYVTVFYFGQALGSSINIQRQNLVKMSFMNHSLQTLNYICEKEPSIEYGSCDLFQAVLMASIPSIMGGSQVKARKMFKKLIKSRPTNLLAHLSFIQYHIIPMMEEDEYFGEMAKLQKKIGHWYGLQKGMKTKYTRLYERDRFFNLFNAISKERYKTLKKLKNELF